VYDVVNLQSAIIEGSQQKYLPPCNMQRTYTFYAITFSNILSLNK